jgi:hypothetical protein
MHSQKKLATNRKRVHFMRIEMRTSRWRSIPTPRDTTEEQQFFTDSYHKYSNLLDEAVDASPTPASLVITEAAQAAIALVEAESQNDSIPRRLDTALPVTEIGPRPVTPTHTNCLLLEENSNIMELFDGIIDPNLLENGDIFVGNGNDACRLCQRIEKLEDITAVTCSQ